MDEKRSDPTQAQPTFTRKRRSTRHILAITIGAVIAILVVAVIVLAIMLARKEKGESHGGDSRDKEGQGQPDRTEPVTVSAFESYGVVNNSLRLSVSYRAPKKHTTDWFIRYQSADTYRTVGTVRNPGNDENAFTTEVTIQDFSDVTLVYLRIYSTSEFAVIEFNYTGLTNKGSANIPAWRNEIKYIDDHIVAPTDTNTNMTIDVTVQLDSDIQRMLNESSKSVAELISEFGDMFIDAVNTTTEPPELYEMVQGFPENIFFVDVTNIKGNLVNLTLSIPAEFVKYGCLLSLSIPEIASTNYVSRIKHGVTVKVLSPETNDVVAENTVAVYPFANETYIFSKRSTVTCFAMGNPHPEVTMYKKGQGQEYISLIADQEELINDEYTHMVGYTVETIDSNNQGQYLCRARSDQATTETTTEVIFAQLPFISIAETGVVENTTERTTIKCQAAGKPRPTIQLNLFEKYGPDLIKTGLYQVTESSSGSDTSVVTLTISPPDPAIHTVYCVTLQNDFERGEPIKIEIFPFDEANGIDWDLYNRMYDLISGQSTTTPSK